MVWGSNVVGARFFVANIFNIQIHIQIPYTAHNNNQTRDFKDICSVPQTALSDTDMCNILLKLYVAFQCHSQNIYFTAPLTPLHLLSNNRHVTTILLRVACKFISTAHNFTFSVSKARLISSTSAECGDVSSCVICSWCNI